MNGISERSCALIGAINNPPVVSVGQRLLPVDCVLGASIREGEGEEGAVILRAVCGAYDQVSVWHMGYRAERRG